MGAVMRSAFVRFEDWPLRLQAYVEERQARPFEWGALDCCTFAAGAVKAIAGADLLAPLGLDYTNEIGAARVVKSYGETVADVATNFLGDPIPVTMAQRGDIVYRPGPLFGSLGVSFGVRAWFPSEGGLIAVLTLDCSQAWAV